MVPKGTHEFKTFIKPHELCQTARTAGLELQGMIGIEYNPIAKRFSLGKNIDVNYIAVFKSRLNCEIIVRVVRFRWNAC